MGSKAPDKVFVVPVVCKYQGYYLIGAENVGDAIRAAKVDPDPPLGAKWVADSQEVELALAYDAPPPACKYCGKPMICIALSSTQYMYRCPACNANSPVSYSVREAYVKAKGKEGV